MGDNFTDKYLLISRIANGYAPTDFTLHISSGKFQQVVGYFQPIHRLQTDGYAPSLGSFPFLRLSLTDILVKTMNVFVLLYLVFIYISTNFRLLLFLENFAKVAHNISLLQPSSFLLLLQIEDT